MPEIGEVERARLRIHRQCLNYKIVKVEIKPDTSIFKDIDPQVFAETIQDKTLVDTKRWGKYFVLIFDEGPSLVAHLGMTGGLRFKHEIGEENWPPKFWKLLITFQDPENKDNTIYFGYKDPIRWGKLRLVTGENPLLEFPINKLGFDPVLNLPTKEVFNKLVLRRSVPVKALLLDQSFSAGVGNWVADEILYQAMIHPGQYTNTLTEKELDNMYDKLKSICQLAVDVEADESKFPADWLMKYRWNKGKKTNQQLPSGIALKFETHGGRTSAFAPSRQILRESPNAPKKKVVVKKEKKAVKKRKLQSSDEEEEQDIDFIKKEEPEVKVKRERNSTRYSFR